MTENNQTNQSNLTCVEVDEDNWFALSKLKVRQDQQPFVADPVGIMARAYAMRASGAEVLAFKVGDDFVGLAMLRNLYEEPACYDLQQFLIDVRYQGKGYGTQALAQILDRCRREGRFDRVDVCVKKEDLAAIALY